MNLKKTLAVAAFALSVAAMTRPADASISLGDMLEVQYFFPTLDLSGVIDDSGVFAYTGPGQSLLTQQGITTVILDDNQVTFSESPGCGAGCFQTPTGGYNGPLLFDFTNTHAFDGWHVISDTVGITSLVNSGSAVGVNWQGATVQGQVVVGVPEPAAWSLMIMGAGLAGAALRRARRGSAATA